MAVDADLEWGGNPGEKMSSKAFLKKAEITMVGMGKKSEEMVEAVELFYKSGSRAEKWHEGLSEEDKKGGWKKYKELLLAEFPATEVVAKSPAEYIKDLVALRLPLEGLDVRDPETNLWAHQKFANQLFELAKAGEIAATASDIISVHKNLPELFHPLVKDDAANWTAFRDSLKEVDIRVIREKLKTAKDIEDIRAQQQRATRAPDTPGTRLANSFSNVQIGQGSGQSRYGSQGMGRGQGQAGDSFAANTGGRGNLQYQGNHQNQTAQTNQRPPARTPRLNEAQKETLRGNVNRYEQRQNNPQGVALWQQDVASHLARWGREEAHERMVYPIAPGTWRPGSGECWGCGARCGGGNRGCLSQTKIPMQERKYRIFVQSELGAFQKPVAQANVVGAGTDLDWMFEGYVSGNVGGSTE
ncbi:hypothetical protein PQX77_008747 [Marasmius sp. AFHP31]|nr:hypothetical protein PQX77_008747 [Marasmius sp. AFHP31]